MDKGCPKYSVSLSAYFDGELDGEDQRAMEAHLASCPGCTADLEKFRRLRATLRGSPGGTPARSVLEGLRALGASAPVELAGRPENVTFSLPRELRIEAKNL